MSNDTSVQQTPEGIQLYAPTTTTPHSTEEQICAPIEGAVREEFTMGEPVVTEREFAAESEPITAGIPVASDTGLSVTDIDNIANAVVNKLLNGSNFLNLSDDMGLPEEFRLGRAMQNYLVWSSRMGVKWALQEPEVLLYMATIFDAMSSASDPASRVAAAEIALGDLKRVLHG